MISVIGCQLFCLIDLLASSTVTLLPWHKDLVLKEFVLSLMMTTLHSHEMSLAKVYPAVLQIQIEERPICQAGCFGYGK